MKLIEMLNVDGTDQFQLLTYIVIETSALDEALPAARTLFNFEGLVTTRLYDEEWPFGIIVAERFFSEKSQIPFTIVDTISKAIGLTGYLSACCMVDGVFCGLDDLMSVDQPDQVYAIHTPHLGVDILMDDIARSSSLWKEIVRKHRETLNF